MRTRMLAALTLAAALAAAAPAAGDVYDDNPAAASRGPGDLYVFARAVDGATLERHWTGSAWTDWASLGGVAASGPAAAGYNGAIVVFVLGTDGAIYQNTLSDGAWRGWQSLGGSASSAPAVAVRRGPLNYLDLAVKGTDNAIWFQSYVPGRGWSGWGPLGGNVTSAPTIASHADGVVDVFARGVDGAPYIKQWDGSAWSDWISQGGGIIGAPAAVSRSPNDLDIYVRGAGNALYVRHWDPNGWVGWTRLDATPMDSSPAVVSDSPSRELLFARQGGQMLYKTGDPAKGLSPWTPWGAVAVPPPPPAPAPPPPDGEVNLEAGVRCTPPGGRLRVHITIRRRAGKPKPRVEKIVFYTRGRGRRVRVDRKAPFTVRMRINRPAGATGRVYARVYFRRSAHGRLHRKTVSRRYVVCR